MSNKIDLFRIPAADNERLRVLFLAKHAESGGSLHGEDGNHAVYHHEVLTTLRAIGLDVTPASDFTALFGPTDHDYLFTLLRSCAACRMTSI